MSRLFFLVFLVVSFSAFSQEVSRVYSSADKLRAGGNYPAALEALDNASPAPNYPSDSLLYLRIRVLEQMARKSESASRTLDTLLTIFTNRVNRYGFPEVLYDDVVRVRVGLDHWKEIDRLYYDSVAAARKNVTPPGYSAYKSGIDRYLATNPNSWYGDDLRAISGSIATEIDNLEKLGKKRMDDSLNLVAMRKMGKRTAITLSYQLASSDLKGPMRGFGDVGDVADFFFGTYAPPLGQQYTLNLSLGNAYFNVFTRSRFKVGIDWAIVDAEYSSFNWEANDLLLDGNGEPITTLRSARIGSRIGPDLMYLLSRKTAISVYYSARPSVMALFHKDMTTDLVQPGLDVYATPDFGNFVLTHEFGVKFRFASRMYVNLFLHKGDMSWSNVISKTGEPDVTATAKYGFSQVGFRLGL